MCWLQWRKFTSRCQVNAECKGEYKFVYISRTGGDSNNRTFPDTAVYRVKNPHPENNYHPRLLGYRYYLLSVLGGKIPDSGSDYRTDSRVER